MFLGHPVELSCTGQGDGYSTNSRTMYIYKHMLPLTNQEEMQYVKLGFME